MNKQNVICTYIGTLFCPERKKIFDTCYHMNLRDIMLNKINQSQEDNTVRSHLYFASREEELTGTESRVLFLGVGLVGDGERSVPRARASG